MDLFPLRKSRSAFTLIELLVVIAIIAILAVVVVLTLNPAQLLAQSRDANRVSDMATLNSALNLYSTDQAGASSFSLGTSTNVYVSIADSSSTCGDLGLPALPSGYSYACASGNRSANGTGWIPVNFQNISAGSPFGSLPVDPTNQTSSGLYYTYSPSSTQFMVTALPESAKQKASLAANPAIPNYPDVIAQGSSLAISPLWNPNGLVGYWPLNEGTGTTAYDLSGNGNNGTWSGTMTNGSYYTAGKVGSYAATFNGSNDYIGTGVNNLPTGSSPRSVFAWVNFTGPAGVFSMVYEYGTMSTSQLSGLALGLNTGVNNIEVDTWGSPPISYTSPLAIPGNSWHFIGFTYNGATSVATYYDNQVATGTITTLNTVLPGSDASDIGRRDNNSNSQYFPGLIDDVRVYNRALSPAEVQSLYNAEK